MWWVHDSLAPHTFQTKGLRSVGHWPVCHVLNVSSCATYIKKRKIKTDCVYYTVTCRTCSSCSHNPIYGILFSLPTFLSTVWRFYLYEFMILMKKDNFKNKRRSKTNIIVTDIFIWRLIIYHPRYFWSKSLWVSRRKYLMSQFALAQFQDYFYSRILDEILRNEGEFPFLLTLNLLHNFSTHLKIQ